MKSVFIQCFCQWVGEEAEGKDSGSGDCDCDCVVEWWGAGKNSLELVDVCWWGETTIVQSRYHAGVFAWLFLLFVFTSTMLLMGQCEESLRKDTNSNSTKNITKYVIEC